MKFVWKRLIRFVGDNGRTQYGEPDIDKIEDLKSLYEMGKLTARPLSGDVFDVSAKFASESVNVKKLLGPLEPAQVPLVKGIGLNYISHSSLSLSVAPVGGNNC